MNFFKNLSIKVWIISIAALLLSLLLMVSLFSLASFSNIAQELTSIAEEDIPVTENLTDITVHQLEQAIHFERAFRYGGLLKREADTQKAQNTRNLFDQEVADFHNRTTQIEKEITRTQKITQEFTKRAHNQEQLKEFTLIGTSLKKIDAEHKDYASHANRVFALLAADNQYEAERLGEKIEAEEDQLDKELELLLAQVEKFTEAATIAAEEHERTAIKVLAILSAIGLLVGLLSSFFAIRNVVNPLRQIRETVETVETVAGGDFDARIGLDSTNEFGELANSFDTLLDDRLASLAAAEKESKVLNTSIIGLLQTVAALAQKDLTARATVTADVTGSVADALNMMTTETAKVLNQVNLVSEDVSTTSAVVKEQSDLVALLAEKERKVVDSAGETLRRTTDSMQEVAELTERSSQTAELAIKATDKAFMTVNDTVQGINATRDKYLYIFILTRWYTFKWYN